MSRLPTGSTDDKVTLQKGDTPISLTNSKVIDAELGSSPPDNVKTDATNEDTTTIPVMKEFLHVEKKIVEKGKIKIIKTVDKEQKEINIPLQYDEIEITTVPVNEFIDVLPEAVRYEGDTMIISVIKEVTVVRMLLEKEIHVSKTKKTKQHVEMVTLRTEKIDIQRKDNNTPDLKNKML